MGRLAFHDNPSAHTSAITVDGQIVGWINQTDRGSYTASTNGRVSAIDGVTGHSMLDVQNHITRIVQAGNVTLVIPVSMLP